MICGGLFFGTRAHLWLRPLSPDLVTGRPMQSVPDKLGRRAACLDTVILDRVQEPPRTQRSPFCEDAKLVVEREKRSLRQQRGLTVLAQPANESAGAGNA